MHWVAERIQQARSKFSSVHERWEQSRKQYDGELTRPDVQDAWQPDIDIPVTWERSVAQIARLVNVVIVQEPVWVATAVPGYEPIAEAVEDFLQWKVRTWERVGGVDFPAWLSELLRHVHVYGIGVVHVFTRSEFAPIFRRRTVTRPLSEEEQAALAQAAPFGGPFAGIKTEEVVEPAYVPRYKGAKAEIVDPRDFFWLPLNAPALEACHFVARRHFLAPWQLIDAANAAFFDPAAAERAAAAPGRYGALQGEENELELQSSDTTNVEVWECYVRRKEDGWREKIVWYAPKADVVLREEENLLSEFRLPFVLFRYEWRQGLVPGKSFAERLYGLHVGINGSINLELESAILANSSALATDDDDLFDELEGRRVRPGEILRTSRPPADAVKVLQLSSGFTQLPMIRAYMEQHADMISATSPSLFGIEQAQRPTAKGTVALIEEAKQPLYRQLESMRASLAMVARHILVREMEEWDARCPFYRVHQNGKTLEEAWLTLSVEEFGDNIIVELNASSESLSRQSRQQLMNDALDRVMAIYQMILGFATQAAAGPANPAWHIFAKAADNIENFAIEVLKEFRIPWLEKLRLGVVEEIYRAAQQQAQQLEQQLAAAQAPGPGPGAPGPGAPAPTAPAAVASPLGGVPGGGGAGPGGLG